MRALALSCVVCALALTAPVGWAQGASPEAPPEAPGETPPAPPAPPAEAGDPSAPAAGSSDAAAATEGEPAHNFEFESPEACFEAAKTAFNERDWRAFVRCVSPERRDALIGQMAATFAMMAQGQDADPRVGELVAKYLPPDFDPMQLLMDEDNQEAMQKMVRRIPNRLGFFAEAMSLAFAMEYPDPEQAATITQLTDLTTGEEALTATGNVHLQVGDQTTQDEWAFEKIGKFWYLTMR